MGKCLNLDAVASYVIRDIKNKIGWHFFDEIVRKFQKTISRN